MNALPNVVKTGSSVLMQEAGVRVALVDCRSMTGCDILQMAILLSKAVKEKPWDMNWNVGNLDDAPSLHGSCCAFIKAYIEKNAIFVRYEYGWSCDLAGFAIGVVADDEIAAEINAGRQEDSVSPAAKAGDFYLAATIIDHRYRGQKISVGGHSMSVYRFMAMLRLNRAHYMTQAIWVRTHIKQGKVISMYQSMGFDIIRFCETMQGGNKNSRLIMKLN